VAILTHGCARNDVDSEEMAGRLELSGFSLVEDAEQAEVVVVNTCGFIEQAKKDSIDGILEAADLKTSGAARAVVATGCMAERYGVELADGLPEADAVLGFDHYESIGARLRDVLDGHAPTPHVPRDRRGLLPLAPADRQASAAARPPGHHTGPGLSSEADEQVPGLGGPQVRRRRLDTSPIAPVKLASGCDRRCTFCAIPAFRGAFVSRNPQQVLQECAWLAAESGVREVFLVSENSTSYGKDLGDLQRLESLLAELGRVPGLARTRVSYLQPAEMRPSLIEAIATTPGVVPYFDLSFQHASPSVLRRMRRFGSTESFLELIADIRRLAPHAGIRSNVIVGFPGETEDDLAELETFLTHASLDAIGVFGYSDEEGTAAASLPDKVEPDEVEERVARVAERADELVSARARARIGEQVEVLVTSDSEDVLGTAEHQGPDVDGMTTVVDSDAAVGELVRARVVDTVGADLIAEEVEPLR
jgi:ribosomal protein S12 methylthiotransferase